MMAQSSEKNKGASQGLFSNYRYLCKKSLLLRAMDNARARKTWQQNLIAANVKRKAMENQTEHTPDDSDKLLKKTKSTNANQENQSTLDSENKSAAASEAGLSEHNNVDKSLRDSWEVDSGFSSEASPPASGRSSPCLGSGSTTVVALDCEMVGTGPGGRCSALARCSVLDYHGNVLYDKYVRPCHPVTDYRTRWSGIRRHHLYNAVPFNQAREEILSILEGKVVVGHAIYNDFEVLDTVLPGHMVRDTCTTRYLSRLAGFPRERCSSLKILAIKLLDRKIQVGKRGHCSVEDALASLDLYKLVEGEWEQELQNKLRSDDAPIEPSFAASNHYMKDEYWPGDVIADSQ
ncbi:hypothetical protein KUCAC02_021559 [Chaenocephalus aceratus]|uniref:Uncharacterized protein n=1 Tax=Chaenocephalus aceratus TaxID=36190 RepID=A0ACB9XGR9_CHAAC|nr:hypothetical protein KUCAC02_021559 [Chaenocephalus aceratus]